MKKVFILLSHFVVVKDFELLTLTLKCAINPGIPQNSFLIFFALNEQRKKLKALPIG